MRWSRAGGWWIRCWRRGKAPGRSRTGPASGAPGARTSCWLGAAGPGGAREAPGGTGGQMTALWDTTGSEVVRELTAARRRDGMTSGLALTLIAVVGERPGSRSTPVKEVEDAATVSAAMHPCRLLVVTRPAGGHDHTPDRLDAEIVVGGRLGPCEAVIMRMQGRLALHADSVVIPLIAADVPVVTWWHGVPPEQISADPLGVVAGRRITDVAQAPDPVAALRQRALDYAAGDTDLAWTRITGWRALLAGALDATDASAW